MTELEGLAVLIVDDEEMLRDVIVDSFKRIGCKVADADGANSAQEIITHGKIDIVISDIRMPNGDGLQLLRWVNNLEAKRPLIIMMSGFSDLNEKNAIEMGAAGLIQKPFRRNDLFEKIRLILANRARVF